MEKELKNFTVGEKIFVRTVTYHHVGEVVGETTKFLLLKDASWIADSGRFYNALKEGTLSEVEPIPGICRINIDAIVDVCPWSHALPTEQK